LRKTSWTRNNTQSQGTILFAERGGKDTGATKVTAFSKEEEACDDIGRGKGHTGTARGRKSLR